MQQQMHRVRKQNIHLPSGARLIDIYKRPQDFGGKDQLIKIPDADLPYIDALIDEYSRPEMFLFGTKEVVQLCQTLYDRVGRPELLPRNGWETFASMINSYNQDI